MILPVMFYAQAVCGLSPTRSALLTAPMAIASGVLAPFVGKLVDRSHPRPIVGFGFSAVAIALTWLSVEMTPTTPIWRLVLPLTADGHRDGVHLVAAGGDRHPQPAAAARGRGFRCLQHHPAGRRRAGQRGHGGVHDVADQRRDAARGAIAAGRARARSPQLPAFLHEPFAAALSQSLLLPAFVALFGVVAALFLRGFGERPDAPDTAGAAATGDRSRRRRRLTTSPTTTTTSSTRSTGTTHPAARRDATGPVAAPAPPAGRADRDAVSPADESDTDADARARRAPAARARRRRWHGGRRRAVAAACSTTTPRRRRRDRRVDRSAVPATVSTPTTQRAPPAAEPAPRSAERRLFAPSRTADVLHADSRRTSAPRTARDVPIEAAVPHAPRTRRR